MKFGENLKLIRKSKNISQEELAEKLGVSRQSVSKWETGENYPSMTNIMCLCDIFKCKINELVHEDFVDINFLDDEIKMNVVKFKQKEQKKMKGLSKAIYIIAKVLKVIGLVGIVLSTIMFVGSLFIVPNSKIDTDNKIITVFGNKINYKIENEELKTDLKNDNITLSFSAEDKESVDKFLNENKIYQTSLCAIVTLSLVVTCFMIFKLFKSIEKLFINIHDKDTPFNNDNVNYIKMIAIYLALCLLIPDAVGILAELIFKLKLNVEISIVNYLIVAIIFALAYVFKYGYEIQLDSKGRIYGDINE